MRERLPSGKIIRKKRLLVRLAKALSLQTPIDGFLNLCVFLEDNFFSKFSLKSGIVAGSAVVFFSALVILLLATTPEKDSPSQGHTPLSISSITGRLKRQVSDIYNVDASFLGDNSLSVLSTIGNAASRMVSKQPPKMLNKQNITTDIVTVSSSGGFKTGSQRLRANNYPSYNLVARKLIQIIRKKGRTGVDPAGLAQKIISESKVQDFDPLFVAAVIKSESAFDKLAVSSAGARGLMQILPSTGTFVAGLEGFEAVMKHRLTDPDYNVKLGIAYLKYLEQMYNGNRMLVLTAYNWGPGRVVDAIEGRRRIPAEVMSYALRILRDHQEWVNELMFAA